MGLTDQEKLDILNNMEIIDEDSSGSDLIYVEVAYTDENLKKLAQIVPDVNEYLKASGDPDGTQEAIDISIAAFQYAGADYYFEGKFVIFTKEQLITMCGEERTKRAQAERAVEEALRRIKEIGLLCGEDGEVK